MFAQITEISSLYQAWRKVRANRGTGGIDAVSLKDFERNLENNLTELARNLIGRTYQPLPARFVRVLKTNGKMRELGILTVRDRVAQRAVLDAAETKFEAEMQDCNFAFRTGRNVEMAIQQILALRANGNLWTVEADIENYFPSIDREILLKDVSRIIQDQEICRLVEIWLSAGMLEETWWHQKTKKIARINALVSEVLNEGFEDLLAARNREMEKVGDFTVDFEEPLLLFENERSNKSAKREAVKGLIKDGLYLAMSHRTLLGGLISANMLGVGGLALTGLALTPKIIEYYRQFFHPQKGILQGSPLSPVLANLYLTGFDKTFQKSGRSLIRYCDDFVILCRTESEAKKALETAGRELAKCKLRLHPEKTRILAPTDEFEFLGYKFLSDGMIEPPPSAAAEMANKLRKMSESVKTKIQTRCANISVKKIEVKTWREYFDIFGKR